MPFKYAADGSIVLADHNGKKLPVFVNAKGEEAPFDADSTVDTIARLNGEARDNRVRAEAAEGKLKPFEGLDPEKARGALDTVGKLDQKKLIDAGEVEKVRQEIEKGFKGEIEKRDKQLADLQESYFQEKLTTAFVGSEYLKKHGAIPADFMQSRFGQHFGLDNGKFVAVDAAGNKIYSKTRHGEPADFDEAMQVLISTHPQRDSLLKGSGASGSGAPNGGGGNNGGGGGGGKRQMTRAEFDAISDPALKMKTAQEAVIVDG